MVGEDLFHPHVGFSPNVPNCTFEKETYQFPIKPKSIRVISSLAESTDLSHWFSLSSIMFFFPRKIPTRTPGDKHLQSMKRNSIEHQWPCSISGGKKNSIPLQAPDHQSKRSKSSILVPFRWYRGRRRCYGWQRHHGRRQYHGR